MGKKSHKELIAKIKQPLKELDTQYKMQGTICNDIEKQNKIIRKIAKVMTIDKIHIS